MPSRARAKQEQSAGGVVFRRGGPSATEPLFLLIRDSYQNWGFPKGHVEKEETHAAAAIREVAEETGLAQLDLRSELDTIDWYFRADGTLVHKVCAFYLIESAAGETCPQHAEGITDCRWLTYAEAARLVSYANARRVLEQAYAMITTSKRSIPA
jgi:8-oxo-dGTP pyrophosphatase MutT (NUDIX family)